MKVEKISPNAFIEQNNVDLHITYYFNGNTIGSGPQYTQFYMYVLQMDTFQFDKLWSDSL
jgi:hypothetical protein